MMEKTGVLCIECLKGRLVEYNKGEELHCEQCGTDFEWTNREKKSYRYKR